MKREMPRAMDRALKARAHGAPAVLAAVGALGMTLTSCSHDCVALPCALPVAIIITVTGATSGAVEGAVVQVSGALVTSMPCHATCRVPGTAGTYTLDVTAPGFAAARRTVVVQGTSPSCGCPTVITESVAVALAAGPSSLGD